MKILIIKEIKEVKFYWNMSESMVTASKWRTYIIYTSFIVNIHKWMFNELMISTVSEYLKIFFSFELWSFPPSFQMLFLSPGCTPGKMFQLPKFMVILVGFVCVCVCVFSHTQKLYLCQYNSNFSRA